MDVEQAAQPVNGHRIALGIAYTGTAFCGWQRQSGQPSVQQSLESVLSQIANAPTAVQAAGRTDTGVHATNQVVHFDLAQERPMRAWLQGANSMLPSAIGVQWAQAVDTGFHARFSASERRYQFLYSDAVIKAPGLSEQSWVNRVELQVDEMHRAAQVLLGEHDFTSFRGAGCQSPTAYRRVHRISVQRHGSLVVLDIAANAFLLHMVRNIAGALQRVGAGEKSAQWVGEMLQQRDRRPLGPTAPPQGLYLVAVRYPGYEFPVGPPPPLLRSLGPLAPA